MIRSTGPGDSQYDEDLSRCVSECLKMVPQTSKQKIECATTMIDDPPPDAPKLFDAVGIMMDRDETRDWTKIVGPLSNS